jgi:hypothetical protein
MDLKNDACCTRQPASVSSNYVPKGTVITIDGQKVLGFAVIKVIFLLLMRIRYMSLALPIRKWP